MLDITFWPPQAFAPFDFLEPQLLIDGLLPWGGSMLMHGPRAAGKTQLALSLASAVHQGSKFLDKYQCERARVAYVEVDMTPRTLQARIRAAGNGLADIAYVTATSPIDVRSVLPPAFGALQRYEPELVIVDSLRKTHKLDENDSNTPTLVYTRWRELVPGAAFCFLHHDRKIPTGPHAGDVDEAFRGSSAWLDDVDTGLHMIRDKRAQGHKAILTFSKLRLAEAQEAIPLTLDPVTMLAMPTRASARLGLLAWLQVNVGATRQQAVAYLTATGYCAKSLAYELADEMKLST